MKIELRELWTRGVGNRRAVVLPGGQWVKLLEQGADEPAVWSATNWKRIVRGTLAERIRALIVLAAFRWSPRCATLRAELAR